MAQQDQQGRLPNGEAAAAVLAAGIGSFALGFFTVLAEAVAGFKTGIRFYLPAGPLSGKTTLAVVVWLVAWAVLYFMWRGKDVAFTKAFATAMLLIGLGVIGTFPWFFELFAGG